MGVTTADDRGTRMDLRGAVFGRLVVLEPIGETVNANTLWVCRCECGEETRVRSWNLRRPTGTRSCGCLRSEAQPLAALGKANRIRTKRAELKRDIRAGRASFLEVLASPPEWLLAASVYSVLLCVPRVGPEKARFALRGDLSTVTTFGRISDRQRAVLVRRLTTTRGMAGRLGDV